MNKLYTLTNKKNIKVYVSNIGAGIFDITLPINNADKSIILHPHDVNDFFFSKEYFGKPCGRTAGRITTSSFTLNGNKYEIENNLPYDVLHGGVNGISFKEFEVIELYSNSITLKYLSPDGESGYPGNLEIEITYTLSDENELNIIHKYKSDQDTLCNITSHLYYNLSNSLDSKIVDHYLYINSDVYGAIDENNVAIKLENVPEAFDFRTPMKISDHLYDSCVQKNLGYNHPYIINHDKEYDAFIEDKDSGIKLSFKSTYDALQLYTCNYPSKTIMNSSREVEKYDAVCLEFQHFPNGINSPFIKNKKDICLKDKEYIEKTAIKFEF